jgi:hypothetical protein
MPMNQPAPVLTATECAVLDTLSANPLDFATLLAVMPSTSMPDLQSAVVVLELHGLANRMPGNRIMRAVQRNHP